METLPADIHQHFLTFLPIVDIIQLATTSHYWHSVYERDNVWKILLQVRYPQHPLVSSGFKKQFIEVYKTERSIKWDPDMNASLLRITDNVVEHIGKYVQYLPIRTCRGYTKGKHYWEATTLSCSYQGSYIGVALESLSEGYYLGSCPAGWGLKLREGILFHKGTPRSAGKQASNGTVIGVLLDMDSFTLRYFYNGAPCELFQFPEWKGKEIFPAICMMAPTDSMKVEFNLPIPKGYL